MVVFALARAYLGASLISPDGLAWDSDHLRRHRKVTLTGTPYLELAMLWVIYIFPWPCKVEALLSPFNEWGSERLSNFPRVTQLISRRAGIVPRVSHSNSNTPYCLPLKPRSWGTLEGTEVTACESAEKSWGGREMSALWGQWRVGQGGGSLGRKYITGGPTSAQCKTVISNDQSAPSPKGMGCLGWREVPAPEVPDKASCYGFHSCQQSRMERDHAKGESRSRGRACSIRY